MVDDQLVTARIRLDAAVERMRELCEPVLPPKSVRDYRNYFCARNLDNKELVAKNEPRREAFYRGVSDYVAALAPIAQELESVGYTPREAASIHKEVAYFQELKAELMRVASDALG